MSYFYHPVEAPMYRGFHRQIDKRCRDEPPNLPGLVESHSGESVLAYQQWPSPCRGNTDRYHATANFRSETYTGIESFRNNIDKPTFADEFQPDVRIALLKHRKLWQEQFINSVLTGINPYRTGRGLAIMGQRGKPHI